MSLTPNHTYSCRFQLATFELKTIIDRVLHGTVSLYLFAVSNNSRDKPKKSHVGRDGPNKKSAKKCSKFHARTLPEKETTVRIDVGKIIDRSAIISTYRQKLEDLSFHYSRALYYHRTTKFMVVLCIEMTNGNACNNSEYRKWKVKALYKTSETSVIYHSRIHGTRSRNLI